MATETMVSATVAQAGEVGQPGDLVQPVGQRDPDHVHPDQLGQHHAVIERPRGQRRERQHRDDEAGRHPGREAERPPRLPGRTAPG